jgi:hypothetical protein
LGRDAINYKLTVVTSARSSNGQAYGHAWGFG